MKSASGGENKKTASATQVKLNNNGGTKGKRWSTIPNRKKAITLFNQGKTIKEIMAEINLSYWQVYNCIAGRSKSNYRPRRDKGQRRKFGAPIDDAENPTDLSAFSDPDDFLKFQTLRTLEKINSSTLPPEESVKALKDCSVILKDIHNREMQNKLKRGDAEIIAQLIRRFKPDASDEEVILIYSEELERYEKAGQ
ncbi:MAG: hypothetical protein EPO24_07745 [Bacteroidetes bacterium]|nr:MAG: hypothetical protein EPO24_07745 [Bacteroidota bacterium]